MNFKIKEARERIGLTQKDLANELGIKPTTFNGYEKGIHDPKSDVLIQIAKKCNVSVDFLLGLNNKMDSDSELIKLNTHEKKVIVAYRKNTKMQDAVDKLLGVNDGTPTVSVMKAARSQDNKEPIGTMELTEEQLERLNNAPRVTDKDL